MDSLHKFKCTLCPELNKGPIFPPVHSQLSVDESVMRACLWLGQTQEDRLNVHSAGLSPTAKLVLRGLSSVSCSQLISKPHTQISLTPTSHQSPSHWFKVSLDASVTLALLKVTFFW